MTARGRTDGSITVAVCTMDRPESLRRTLHGLEQQTDTDFDVVVIDDSTNLSDAAGERLRVVPGDGDGLSRARNRAWQEADSEWVVYLDDDVVPDERWIAELRRAMRAHPEADVVSGRVDADPVAGGADLVVTIVEVEREQVLTGRRVRPWLIGLTVAMAIRRRVLEELGGYDERLGPGRRFPSAEDVDINYRILRAGGIAFVTPDAVARHVQWREPPALGPHFRGYMTGWTGFAMKHLRQGDVVGGLWLWTLGLEDLVRMTGSAFRRRSLARLRVAGFKLQGLVVGTCRGLLTRW